MPDKESQGLHSVVPGFKGDDLPARDGHALSCLDGVYEGVRELEGVGCSEACDDRDASAGHVSRRFSVIHVLVGDQAAMEPGEVDGLADGGDGEARIQQQGAPFRL